MKYKAIPGTGGFPACNPCFFTTKDKKWNIGYRSLFGIIFVFHTCLEPDLILQAYKKIAVCAPCTCRSCTRPAVIASVREKKTLKRVVHVRVRLKSLLFMYFFSAHAIVFLRSSYSVLGSALYFFRLGAIVIYALSRLFLGS